MSNLDYPMSILIAKAEEIQTSLGIGGSPSSLQLTGDNIAQRVNQLEAIGRAVIILNNVKFKDDKKEREMKEKEKKRKPH